MGPEDISKQSEATPVVDTPKKGVNDKEKVSSAVDKCTSGENKAEKKTDCPFLATESKKSSPFLTSTLVGTSKASADDFAEDLKAKESIIRKQHKKLDDEVRERSIFNDICKLYFMSEKTKRFETRGNGKIIILKDDSGLYKIMMYRDMSMLKGCNHYIGGTCKLTKLANVENTWAWVALNDKSDAEHNPPKTIYSATFKTTDLFNDFEKKYNEAQVSNAALIKAGAAKTQ